GGMISVTGEPDRPPVKPGPSIGDTGTGMLMAITILGSLIERQRTGQGRRLQVAMQDAMLHYMRTCFAVQARTGKAAARRGGKTVMGANAPSGLYQCTPYGPNDWIYVMTSRANPEHWARLMKLFGREELIDDPRYATGAARIEHEAEVDGIVTEWTRKHTKEEAMTLISGVGVPAGADQRHGLFLGVLARPLGDDRVDLGLMLDPGGAGGVTRIVDQLLAREQLHQPGPVLGVGAARHDVDPVVGAVRRALIEAGWRVGAHDGLPAASRRRFPRARLHREAGAHVVEHRVLHRHLQPPSLAGSLTLDERAENRDRHQHAGAGVADARAGLDRRPGGLAGHADHAAGGLRDHVD